jgi:Domain of unknown function (DUF4173)
VTTSPIRAMVPEPAAPGPLATPAEARPRVLVAVAVAAVAAAVALPLDRPGLGWLLTALAALGGTALSAMPVAAGQLPWPARLERLWWSAATVALLAVGTFRSAGWLFVLCVLVACVTGPVALTGGRTFRGLALSTVVLPAAALRALPWGGRGLRSLRAGGGSPLRLLAAGGVGLLLLVVFGALFAAADAAFAELVGQVFGDVDPGRSTQAVTSFALVGAATLGAAYLLASPPAVDPDPGSEPIRRPLRVLEWALPVALLDALFATFVAVQLTVLFGGRAHVLGTGGPTYAEYARSGFWQLVVVTVLTLGVIGLVARLAPRATAAERFWLRALLGVLACLTLVIVASALKRLALYDSEYGFTRLRVLVGACEIWLGGLFLLVLVAGIRLRARWLPRVALGTGVAALLALAALNPDRFIAEHNIDRYYDTGRIDVRYLGQLSPDAVPAVARLPGAERTCAFWYLEYELYRQDAWFEYNLGRVRARAVLASRDRTKVLSPCSSN